MKRNYENKKATSEFLRFSDDPSLIPFIFRYKDKEYRGFSPRYFDVLKRRVKNVGGKETHTFDFCFTDGIYVTLVLSHYASHGVTEWTVLFENRGDAVSGIFEGMESELIFEGTSPVLSGILGDHGNLYKPYKTELSSTPSVFTSDSGRATHGNFPYFNLSYGDEGAMLAIGWAGTWHASFTYEDNRTVYRSGAVNGLKTKLKKGEKIRSALFVKAPYSLRSEMFSSSYWRDWYIKYNLPKADLSGKAPLPFSTCCLASDTGLPNSDGSISERHSTWRPSLEKMLSENIHIDYRWFDAGWYVHPNGESEEVDWWGSVGAWELDPVKWPGKSFKESTDFAREHGMKTLVWFEPERITDPENLSKNFGYKKEWAITMHGDPRISNNIGDPDCLEWTLGRIKKMLTENRVEMYREDNNCDAAELWKFLDGKEGENRRGITEMKFISAHYNMWDQIIACTLSYGGCGFVDSCASGGGRNDLESMRRGIPLLRSDSDRTSTALRLSMTWGFNQWIPFCGACSREQAEELSLKGISDPYVWRASYLPVMNVSSQFVYDETQDFSMLRFGLSEWESINRFLLCEFYPLTPWRSPYDKTGFTAFAYYDPENEDGIILAFRQEECKDDTVSLELCFEKNGKYLFTDRDSGESFTAEASLELRFLSPRSAKLLSFKRIS